MFARCAQNSYWSMSAIASTDMGQGCVGALGVVLRRTSPILLPALSDGNEKLRQIKANLALVKRGQD